MQIKKLLLFVGMLLILTDVFADGTGVSTIATVTVISAQGSCDVVANQNLDFSTLNPGTSSATATVTVTNNGEIPVNFSLSGIDWSDGAGHSIAVGQTVWSTIDSVIPTPLSTSEASLGTLSAAQSLDVNFSVAIPANQFPATYTQSITFTASC